MTSRFASQERRKTAELLSSPRNVCNKIISMTLYLMPLSRLPPNCRKFLGSLDGNRTSREESRSCLS